MKQLFSVPNLLSLGNLLCGCMAIFNVIDGNIGTAVYLVLLACVFDFLDGFAARGLKQGSPMGKELDSLADMVTFGVVPGMVMFQMIRFSVPPAADWGKDEWEVAIYPYVGFIIPLFSALRLAKFNVDTRQSESFIGLPTLANALMICGLPILFEVTDSDKYQFTGYNYELLNDHIPNAMNAIGQLQTTLANFWRTQAALMSLSVVMSILLISPIPMFSFKVKSLKWKGNETRYIFLAISAFLFALLKLAALPVVILVYIVMSVIYAISKRRTERV